LSQSEFYRQTLMQIKAICEGEPNLIANLSNIAAVLYNNMTEVNWAGFYIMAPALNSEQDELVLGPFQGQAACVRIPVGRGVCGTAVAESKSQLVYDVHEFAGHIACDAASNSEVVIPLMVDGKTVGVLDIDSPAVGRFNEEDLDGLEQVARYVESIWS